MSKARFANEALRVAFQLGQLSRMTRDLIQVYTDRGYGSADPLTVEDVNTQVPGYPPLDTPLTLAQFNEIASMLVELTQFMGNQAVATKNRELVINKYRQDL